MQHVNQPPPTRPGNNTVSPRRENLFRERSPCRWCVQRATHFPLCYVPLRRVWQKLRHSILEMLSYRRSFKPKRSPFTSCGMCLRQRGSDGFPSKGRWKSEERNASSWNDGIKDSMLQLIYMPIDQRYFCLNSVILFMGYYGILQFCNSTVGCKNGLRTLRPFLHKTHN